MQTTQDLVKSMVVAYTRHLDELAGQPAAPAEAQDLSPEFVQALVKLLAVGVQQAYPVGASEPNYSGEDMLLAEYSQLSCDDTWAYIDAQEQS